ncbi:MAG: alpha/beta hydrolase [Polyangiaceae bacterium]|nr:alpha/beta hydrolase [Polyangiaceae bacterium]
MSSVSARLVSALILPALASSSVACGADETSDAGGSDTGGGAEVGGHGGGDGGAPTCPEIPERQWWELGMEDYVLDSVVLHYLGQAYHQSADVGEVLETASRVDPAVSGSWMTEWQKTAQRLDAVANESEEAGHPLSASQAYLRAATYYRAALHHQEDPYAPIVKELAEAEVTSFERYLALSGSPCEPVSIPYEDTTLPGYFCRSPVAEEPAPVLLFQEGRDAWAEDGKFIADEAMKRGYHALLFDGPGMAKVIRIEGLPFRHDWENVITPVIDFAVARPDVDASRIGLVSVSMGGYMGPRAAAFDHRLKVLVANPGVLDWSAIYEGFLDAIDPELLPLLDSDEGAFNERIEEYMQANELLAWGLVDSMWHHGVDTPAALMKELRKYTIADVAGQITAHTLVVDAEAEEWGQSQALYDALTCPKDYLLFTAEEAAQFHVQPGAVGIASHRLFDWIDDAL